MARLKDKVCLVTGGSSGMGRVACGMFAREGAKVFFTDRDEEGGRETLERVRASGGEARFHAGDVARETDVKKTVAAALDAYGRIDALYNNAGVFLQEDGSVLDAPEAAWDKTLAVNLKGVSLFCKHAIPPIVEAGGGSVVNVASFVALVGCSVPQDAYTASKGAVIALTKSLAVQFGPKGVRANAICPGPIETPLLMEWLLTNPAEKKKRLDRIPMGRFGRAEDVASLALFLASDESSWINGAAIPIDGGITANYF